MALPLRNFSSVLVLAEAINIAKVLMGCNNRGYQNTKFDALLYYRRHQIDAKGQNEILASYMVQTQNGKYQAVYPEEVEQQNL